MTNAITTVRVIPGGFGLARPKKIFCKKLMNKLISGGRFRGNHYKEKQK